MKVAVAAHAPELNSEVHPRVGRVPLSWSWASTLTRRSPTTTVLYSNAGQDAGIGAGRTIIDLDVGALLTGDVGPKALDMGNVVNEGVAQRLEDAAAQYGVTPVRRIPCAPSATRAPIDQTAVADAFSGSVGKANRLVWDTVLHRLQASVPSGTSSLVQLAWTLKGQWTRNAGQNTVTKGILHGEGLGKSF